MLRALEKGKFSCFRDTPDAPLGLRATLGVMPVHRLLVFDEHQHGRGRFVVCQRLKRPSRASLLNFCFLAK